MENSKIKSLTGQVQLLLKNNWDFPQRLKQRLVLESNNVTNPYKFIAGLFTEGVLCDESSDPEASFGLKEMMVQLAITIACSKGADAICGLMKALEGSGNSQLISALRTWAKENFGIEINGKSSEQREGLSAKQSLTTEKLPKSPTESTAIGTKLIDKMTSRVEDDFMEELEFHLVCKASGIVNTAEFCTSLVHQNILEETDIGLAAGPEVHGRQEIEKFIKVVCSNKAIGSLVLALESSNNKRILAETYDWLQTSPARKKNYPISLKSLARQSRATAIGLLAATEAGIISLDLRTLDVTSLMSDLPLAVAVNRNLKKVYWSAGGNSSIMRSNFDGSAKETIVSQTGSSIFTLAIDEPSGDVYFARNGSHEITVCNAVGQNRNAVISNPSLVNFLVAIALDSDKGLMYWGNRPNSSSHSLVRANMDGSNAGIISTGFKNLYGIVLDKPSNDVLYWADLKENVIGTIHANGGDKGTLLKLEGNSGPSGIQVDAHKIYFGNYNGKNIQSVDKGSGKEYTTIFNSSTIIRHLALFNTHA